MNKAVESKHNINFDKFEVDLLKAAKSVSGEKSYKKWCDNNVKVCEAKKAIWFAQNDDEKKLARRAFGKFFMKKWPSGGIRMS